MYYNMYCYHVASIHNQSWTGLLIMETVDQSVSCNLVGVFFFSISMQSFIVQLSEIRNFMISFVITSKYLHVYDKEIFDLKPMGHAFTCHIGIIKSVHIYYCTHVYMYRYLKKKKVHFECVYEVKSCLSYTGDGIASDLTSDPSFLLEACGRHGAMEKVSVTWQQQSAIFVECLPLFPQRGLCKEISTLYIYMCTCTRFLCQFQECRQ